MKLDTWMTLNKASSLGLAKRLGHNRADKVLRWRNGACRPSTDVDMQRLYIETGGQVSANDFFNISIDLIRGE